MDLKTLFGIESPRKQVASPSTILTKTATVAATAVPGNQLTAQRGQILPFPVQITPVQNTVINPSVSTSGGTPAPANSGPPPSLSTSAGSSTAPIPGQAGVSPATSMPINYDSAVPAIPASPVFMPPNLPGVSISDQAIEQAIPEGDNNIVTQEMPMSLAAKILLWVKFNKRKLMWGALAIAGVVVGAKVWKKVRK